MATPWFDSGGRNRPPCKGCPDRKPACSDHCRKPEFLKWKAEKEKIDKARKAGRDPDGYTAEQVIKNRRVR